jgi:hypothetical protein
MCLGILLQICSGVYTAWRGQNIYMLYQMDTLHIDAHIPNIVNFTNRANLYKKVKKKKEPGCSSTPSAHVHEAYQQGKIILACLN